MNLLSAHYCQPSWAYSMDGYGVDIYAPRKPFVTVTLLMRPSKWLWRPAVTLVWWVFADWLPLGEDDDDPNWGYDPAAFALHGGAPYLRPMLQRARARGMIP